MRQARLRCRVAAYNDGMGCPRDASEASGRTRFQNQFRRRRVTEEGRDITSAARWGVGQLADRRTVNAEVAGSSPAAPVPL